MAMHADELPIDAAMVRDLVGTQFHHWRGLHVRRVTSPGTVNAIFRLGDRLTARFPLRSADPTATRRELESEAAAARELAAATRFPVPAPVGLGEPGPGYPLPWSVQTWLPGRTGDEDDPSGEVTFASDLAEFIAAVRATGTRGRTFTGRGRGGDLKDHDDEMRTCLRQSEGILDVRRLTGVLDVGSYCAADPALDLISAWNLLEDRPRQVLRTALRCTSLEWERSKAWAFQQAMGLVWYYADSNPVMSRLGRTTLGRIMSASEVLPERAAGAGSRRRPARSLPRRSAPARVSALPGPPGRRWPPSSRSTPGSGGP